MTADHAGQTGGEREDAHEAAVAMIRTWIDRHPRPQYGDDRWWPDWAARNFLADPEVREHVTLVTPSRPVSVPGQASRERDTETDTSVPLVAREAAVEAVARWLAGGRLDGATTQYVERNKPMWLRAAEELLSLPEVAALSAAPGQEQP